MTMAVIPAATTTSVVRMTPSVPESARCTSPRRCRNPSLRTCMPSQTARRGRTTRSTQVAIPSNAPAKTSWRTSSTHHARKSGATSVTAWRMRKRAIRRRSRPLSSCLTIPTLVLQSRWPKFYGSPLRTLILIGDCRRAQVRLEATQFAGIERECRFGIILGRRIITTPSILSRCISALRKPSYRSGWC